METSLYNWIKRQAHASVYADRAYCLRLTATDFSPGQPVLSGAMFFFLLPLNGSVRLLSVTDEPFASLRPGQMVVLSPSMEARLGTPEGNFSALCLLLEPLFFDSLSASQQVYSQLVMLSPGGSPVPFAIAGRPCRACAAHCRSSCTTPAAAARVSKAWRGTYVTSACCR